ncbi:excinuclease ABC subunit UvrB [bacterium]|nr:excinuclease ABC subunit UvrB [bacterium]
MFKLKSNYQPAGDQPKAIQELTDGLAAGEKFQTLLGVTGSGKTFTMANVIQNTQRPTLVIAHNKTLAAQLCNEFREFFPENAVEYFVSYYDYYQPEAYMPRTDTFIEKEAMINQEIDRLRHSATQALLTRRDVIIVASVSCIYGLGSPKEYKNTVMHIKKGEDPATALTRSQILHRLVDMQFERTTADLERGHFRARGEVLEIMPMNEEMIYRLTFEEEIVRDIVLLDSVSRKELERAEDVWIFPAKHYVVSPEHEKTALDGIKKELDVQLAQFKEEGKLLESERISRRTRYDLEMIKNVGYCNGIENYSRHFDGRVEGEPPYTLMDYFPEDFLTVIDESHVSVSQIGGMYAGDRARKDVLVEHGFRLPSARDNRPLKFEEFEKKIGQTVFVSATPGKYEKQHSERFVEQIIRPTGLVDPEIDMRPVTGDKQKGIKGQVEDLIEEIVVRVEKGERTLVTTLTKKMAEDLTEFLKERKIMVQYLHSDVETLDRITILSDLRKGKYDVLVGVNLLREGLDLPEVTLVAILDADKEGFLRSETSIIQTIGRAARNVGGRVILYADHMTGSLDSAIKETNRRRAIQIAHNEKHGITPQTIIKTITDIRGMLGGTEDETEKILNIEVTAEPKEIEALIKDKNEEMRIASHNLDFETAAILRDEIVLLKKELKEKKELNEKTV